MVSIARSPLPAAAEAGTGRLELVTADGLALVPFGVLYVDATLAGKADATPSPVFLSQAIDPSEKAMHSDPAGLLPFLFGLQWLLTAAVASRWLSRSWGRWQAWIVSVPVLLVLGATTADAAASLLPNLT